MGTGLGGEGGGGCGWVDGWEGYMGILLAGCLGGVLLGEGCYYQGSKHGRVMVGGPVSLWLEGSGTCCCGSLAGAGY